MPRAARCPAVSPAAPGVRRALGWLLALLSSAGCSSSEPPVAPVAQPVAPPPAPVAPPPAPTSLLTVQHEAVDAAEAAWLRPVLEDGLSVVASALGRTWLEPVTVSIVPDRAAYTASFPAEYGMTETQCWMVAWAVADRLVVLSPRAWRGPEVCEHDPDDHEEVALLLHHELVHALHGQHNPTRDFTGMEEELGWFIEGLATFASGQLERKHAGDARAAIAAGAVPESLSVAWSGRWRYGVCGSLVAYLEHRCGRERLAGMMAATKQAQLLEMAGLTEAELLAAWKEWAAG
jgi:hypothetical protein